MKLICILIIVFGLSVSCSAQQGSSITFSWFGPAVQYKLTQPDMMIHPAFDFLSPVSNKQLPSVSSIPPTFYMSHLGFFCKEELQVQSVTHLPVKFRLGSVAYTDHMEGKDQ